MGEKDEGIKQTNKKKPFINTDNSVAITTRTWDGELKKRIKR